VDIESYPHIKNIGNKCALSFKDCKIEGRAICIQLKVDGSNVAFWKNHKTGEVMFRSRNLMLDPCGDRFDKKFKTLVTEINSISDILNPGYVYRGEYFENKKLNVIEYNRVPKHNFVLFDLQEKKSGKYMDVLEVLNEALSQQVPYKSFWANQDISILGVSFCKRQSAGHGYLSL